MMPGGPAARVGERCARDDEVHGGQRGVDGAARGLPGPGPDEGHRVVREVARPRPRCGRNLRLRLARPSGPGAGRCRGRPGPGPDRRGDRRAPSRPRPTRGTRRTPHRGRRAARHRRAARRRPDARPPRRAPRESHPPEPASRSPEFARRPRSRPPGSCSRQSFVPHDGHRKHQEGDPTAGYPLARGLRPARAPRPPPARQRPADRRSRGGHAQRDHRRPGGRGRARHGLARRAGAAGRARRSRAPASPRRARPARRAVPEARARGLRRPERGGRAHRFPPGLGVGPDRDAGLPDLDDGRRSGLRRGGRRSGRGRRGGRRRRRRHPDRGRVRRQLAERCPRRPGGGRATPAGRSPRHRRRASPRAPSAPGPGWSASAGKAGSARRAAWCPRSAARSACSCSRISATARSLRVDGVPVGRHAACPGTRPTHPAGSCIVVVATDAPLAAPQLERVARRAGLGLARTGSTAHHGSGEIFLAFATDGRRARDSASSERPASSCRTGPSTRSSRRPWTRRRRRC